MYKLLRLSPLFFTLACATDEMSQETSINNESVEIETEWERDDEGGCPESWVLTYSLTGRVDITDTPLNIGNADAFVGGLDSDELTLRIPNDNGKPADGQVLLTSFKLLQDFEVTVNMVGDISIVSYLLSTSHNECGVASGTMEGAYVTWDECIPGSNYGSPSWSPQDGANGTGCINNYTVEGTVECIDDAALASCDQGWLNDGPNEINDLYNQPLLDFQFSNSDLESFTMKGSQYGTELPTSTNNRTWLSLEGKLKSQNLEPTPDCLCLDEI